MTYIVLICFLMMVLGVLAEIKEYREGGVMNIGNDTLCWTTFWAIMVILTAPMI